MLSFIVVSLALTGLVSAEKLDKYTQVEGKCDDLKPVENYDQATYIKEEWRQVQASFLKQGDKCPSTKMTDEGNNKLAVAIKVYSTESNSYKEITNALIHNGDGTYKAENNAKGVVLMTDYETYQAYIQCAPSDNGKSQVLLGFSTRDGKVDATAQAKFDEITKKLEEAKLFPPMQAVSQEDCPE